MCFQLGLEVEEDIGLKCLELGTHTDIYFKYNIPQI